MTALSSLAVQHAIQSILMRMNASAGLGTGLGATVRLEWWCQSILHGTNLRLAFGRKTALPASSVSCSTDKLV